MVLALAATGTLCAGGAVYAMATEQGHSRCAMFYAETGDEQYRTASAWTCYWAEQHRTVQNMERDLKAAVASAAEHSAQQQQRQQQREQRAREAEARAPLEAAVVDELRVVVCAALARHRGTPEVLEADLVGLSGHAAIYSIEAVCRDCPDEMRTYFDATGARFCTVGGKGGKSCGEAKPFPHTASVTREGTADALWIEFGCR